MDSPIIKSILNAHWDWSVPVKVDDIAHKLGIYISELNENNPEHLGLSGLAEINNNNRFVYFNRTESKNRQRFTIAHEIGHHQLAHVTNANPKYRDDAGHFSSQTQQWEEIEANQFAAELLMPQAALEFMIHKKGMTHIPELANTFEVSEAAMYYRLRNSGLLAY